MVNKDNFYNNTQCQFIKRKHPSREPDEASESGSKYWFTTKGVFRYSDHWGLGIASCNWRLKGDEWMPCTTDEVFTTGFAEWRQFRSIINVDEDNIDDIKGVSIEFDDSLLREAEEEDGIDIYEDTTYLNAFNVFYKSIRLRFRGFVNTSKLYKALERIGDDNCDYYDFIDKIIDFQNKQ